MPPITLLPGLACDAEIWQDQIRALSPRYTLQVSDAHTRFTTLPEMAAAVLADQPGDLRLCGTSMGGMLALEILRQAPQRVKALALLASSARPDTPELIALRNAAIPLFEQGRMHEVLEPNVPLALHPAHVPALAGRYLAMMERAGAAQLVAQNRAIMARPDQRPWLPRVACPTLVVFGSSDQILPAEQSLELAALIPGSRMEVLSRCGHLLTWEQPEAVNALLMDWLAGL